MIAVIAAEATYTILVIDNHHEAAAQSVKDIKELGISNVLHSTGALLKRELNQLFLEHGLYAKKRHRNRSLPPSRTKRRKPVFF